MPVVQHNVSITVHMRDTLQVEIYFVDVNGQALGVLNEGKNRALQLGLRYEFEL